MKRMKRVILVMIFSALGVSQALAEKGGHCTVKGTPSRQMVYQPKDPIVGRESCVFESSQIVDTPIKEALRRANSAFLAVSRGAKSRYISEVTYLVVVDGENIPISGVVEFDLSEWFPEKTKVDIRTYYETFRRPGRLDRYGQMEGEGFVNNEIKYIFSEIKG